MKSRLLCFFLLLCWLPVRAQEDPNWIPWIENCQGAQVLYLGEEHDSILDHQLQARTLQALQERGHRLVVVAEMFQLPARQVLDDYVAGKLNDQQLFEDSEWKKRWGHAWEQYLPIWQICQREKIPLRALRNSNESGRQLNKLGSAAFTVEERQGLAPEPYEFGPHPESLRPVFEAHAGPVSQAAFERFLAVQTLWEEFMAAQIRHALRQNPDGTVVVLVGKGHLLHGHGLPARVAKHWPGPLVQKVALVNPNAEEKKRADCVWITSSNSSTSD